MDEVKNNKVLRGTELMDNLVQKECEHAPSMSREELESNYVTTIKLRGLMWKENLKLGRTIRKLERKLIKKDAIIKKQSNAILLKTGKEKKVVLDNGNSPNIKESVFRISDMGMRYFQVKNGSRYQVLIQDCTYANMKRSDPQPVCDGNGGNLVPICEGHSWSLERCVGIVDVRVLGDIKIEDERDYVEVEPRFQRVFPEDENYPDGGMIAGHNKIQVEILIPPSHPFEKLNQMVGCEEIKKRLAEFKCLTEYNKACLHQSLDYPVMEIFLHSVFYGNPGTGKTTICRLYGALLKEAGLLSKGHVVVADRNIFCGENFGNTEEMIPQLLEMSKGGILMFDEAYLLEGTHPHDPNKMVLPLLLSALADEKKKDFAVVLCGYKDKLDKMIEQNPGLYSRFINKFEFKDYTLDELTEIGVRYLNKYGHYFSDGGLASFREHLKIAMSKSNNGTWANARSVKSMIDNTYVRRAMRYSKDGKLDRIITAEDVSDIPCDRHRRIGFSM